MADIKQQVVVEFVTDTSQLDKTGKTVQDQQQKAASTTKKLTEEVAKQTTALKDNKTASDQLSKQKQKELDVYNKLTQSLEHLTQEGQQAVRELLKLNTREIVEGFEELGISVEEYLTAFQKFDSPKKRLRELTLELNRLEEAGMVNTQRFRDLAKEAGALRDQIGDVQATINALASDTATVDGLIDAVGGLAGGFAAVQGATALFADENEDLQKALLKVNAAMSILQGVQQIQNVLQKESAASILLLQTQQKIYTAQTNLATAAESKNIVVRYGAIAAQKILNAVMSANPIGLVITALAAVSAALVMFARNAGKAAEEQAKLNAAVSSASELLDAEVEGYESANKKILSDLQLRNAKTSELAKQDLRTRKNILNATERELSNLRTALASSDAEEREEANKKIAELEKRSSELRTDIYVQENEVRKALQEEELDRREKLKQDAEKRTQELKAQLEARVQAEKAAAEQLEALRNEIALQGIRNEFRRRREQLDQELEIEVRKVRENELLKASTKEELEKALRLRARNNREQIDEEEQQSIIAQEKQFQTELAALKEQIVLDSIKDQGERELQAIRFNQERQRASILSNTALTEEQRLELLKQYNIIAASEIAKQEQVIREQRAAERLKGIDAVINDTKRETAARLAAVNEERAALAKYYLEGSIGAEEYRKKQEELAAKEQDLLKQGQDKRKQELKERIEGYKQLVQVISQTAEAGLGILEEAWRMQSEKQLQGIEDQKARVKELREAGAITAKDEQRRLLELEKQEKRIKTDQAKRDKAIALFQAIINGASAVVEALPNPVLVATAAAVSAAQIALIAARPIPKFAVGKKGKYEGLGIVGEAGTEMHVTKDGALLHRKPTLTWVGKDDTIFTAAETKAILGDLSRRAQESTLEYSPVIDMRMRPTGVPTGAIGVRGQEAKQPAFSIDYDKLGQSLAKHIPKYGMMVDENGFTEYLEKANSFKKYLDKRRGI